MLEKVVVPILIGLFGLLPAAVQWLAERNRSRSRQTRIQRLTSEVEFLAGWHKAARIAAGETAAETDERARRHLDALATAYEALLDADRSPQAREVGRLRRSLLLYWPDTDKAKLVHAGFYVVACTAVGVVLTEQPNFQYDPDTGSNDFIDLIIGSLIVFAPLLIGLQHWATRLHRRAVRGEAPPGTPPPGDASVVRRN